MRTFDLLTHHFVHNGRSNLSSLAWAQFTVGPPLTPVTMLDHLSSCQRLAWRLHLWRSTIMTQLASVSAFQRLSSSVWLFCCIGSLSTWTCVILEWKPWRSLGSFMTFYNNDTTSVHECLSAPVSICMIMWMYWKSRHMDFWHLSEN